jgi:spherulation-specific family 4 protein
MSDKHRRQLDELRRQEEEQRWSANEARPQERRSVGTQQMAIPAYFYATKPEWTQLQSSGGPVSIAVMNPSSGPGSLQNLDYVNTVNKTKDAGVRVFAYVWTEYGDRSLSDVKSDID